MDARHPAETRASEHGALTAFAPFSEMMNHSRACFEKSFTAMREETVGLLNRLHDHNGEMLAEFHGTPNLAKLTNAQEKWFADLSRDMYQATMRLHETARSIFAETFENVGQSMRNGAAAEPADEAKARGSRAMRAARAETAGEAH